MDNNSTFRRPVKGIVALVGAVGLAASLAGCGAGDARCEQIINETVSQVEGVVSAEATCDTSFGSSSYTAGAVHLDAGTKDEGYAVIERIQEAMAREPEIEADWSSPVRMYLSDGSTYIISRSKVGEIRERLGIEP
jgi:hypothetical protein